MNQKPAPDPELALCPACGHATLDTIDTGWQSLIRYTCTHPDCAYTHDINAKAQAPEENRHTPCCSSHGIDMTCTRYRQTHFVEVRPCCAADAALLRASAAQA